MQICSLSKCSNYDIATGPVQVSWLPFNAHFPLFSRVGYVWDRVTNWSVLSTTACGMHVRACQKKTIQEKTKRGPWEPFMVEMDPFSYFIEKGKPHAVCKIRWQKIQNVNADFWKKHHFDQNGVLDSLPDRNFAEPFPHVTPSVLESLYRRALVLVCDDRRPSSNESSPTSRHAMSGKAQDILPWVRDLDPLLLWQIAVGWRFFCWIACAHSQRTAVKDILFGPIMIAALPRNLLHNPTSLTYLPHNLRVISHTNNWCSSCSSKFIKETTGLLAWFSLHWHKKLTHR